VISWNRNINIHFHNCKYPGLHYKFEGDWSTNLLLTINYKFLWGNR
jgi:hypothetical protein